MRFSRLECLARKFHKNSRIAILARTPRLKLAKILECSFFLTDIPPELIDCDGQLVLQERFSARVVVHMLPRTLTANLISYMLHLTVLSTSHTTFSPLVNLYSLLFADPFHLFVTILSLQMTCAHQLCAFFFTGKFILVICAGHSV